ncbi:hypothetical protein Y032_0031g2258 [Ancylostoma ceylanicum]|nr:hypothetical protein Y032_0031g2258 [Ancylostoma ceylanicum]
MGYIMGKAEGRDENWHGHVTALSVAPDYRRLGLGARMMYTLEHISDMKKAYFVDLFVRVSNHVAISMYKALGYVVYREIIDYYSGPHDENAYGTHDHLRSVSSFMRIFALCTCTFLVCQSRLPPPRTQHSRGADERCGCLVLSRPLRVDVAVHGSGNRD